MDKSGSASSEEFSKEQAEKSYEKQRLELLRDLQCKGCNSTIAKGVKVNAVKELVGKAWRYDVDCPCCVYKNVMYLEGKGIEEDGSKKKEDSGASLEEASGPEELKKKRKRTRWDSEIAKSQEASLDSEIAKPQEASLDSEIAKQSSISEYKKIKNKQYWDCFYPDVPESERFDAFERYCIAVISHEEAQRMRTIHGKSERVSTQEKP